jgi:hypothetical protein
VSELQEQPDQPGAPPGLTGKVVEIGVHQAVSLRELRTPILGATRPVTSNVGNGHWAIFNVLASNELCPDFR